MTRCRTGKVRFGTEALARAVLVGAVIRRNAGSTKRREQRAYPCDRCDGWHLTSKERVQ